MLKRAFDDQFKAMPAQDIMIDKTPCQLPAQEISFLHYHDRFEIGQCISGAGIFMTQAQAQAIRPGDLLFFPPGVRHYSRSIDKCMCRFVYVKANAIAEHLTADVPTVIRPGDPAWEELQRLMTQIDKPQAAKRIALHLSLFLLEANSCYPSAPIDATTEPMADYLTERYNQPLTTKDMAAAFHLSESQLRRRFIAQYGMPPMAYRNRLRCQIGRELLMHTNRTIADIADHLGFSAPSDFYRLFRKFYNISPRQARQKKGLR